jgi:hypothetical protein
VKQDRIKSGNPKYVWSHGVRFLNPKLSEAYDRTIEELNPWLMREAANNLSDTYAKELRYFADLIEQAQADEARAI